jgi:hypothetical protein
MVDVVAEYWQSVISSINQVNSVSPPGKISPKYESMPF